jgi:hypothetical protein
MASTGRLGFRHKPLCNPKTLLEQHMNDRRKAVGCATRIGDNVVLGGIVFVVVDPHHDRNVLAFRRGRNNHLFCPGFKMALGLRAVGKEAG